jgi:hypothetical protein
MASQYDSYWTGRAEDLCAAVLQAASGQSATIDVRDLRMLGRRKSWSGKVVVRGREAAPAEMAHAVSLGRFVAVAGICEPWPDQAFRFAVSNRGMLTVTLADDARLVTPTESPPSPGMAAALRMHDTNPRSSAGGASVDPAAGCSRVHAALTALPLWSEPAQVPFANGLYFFYERGERSMHAPQGRVVRIGNHPQVQDRLRDRLREHYGGVKKNGSVFRRYLGGALLRRQDTDHPCLKPAPGRGHWEQHGPPACCSCAPVEFQVTELLRDAFAFRCVSIDDMEERNECERWLIGTLAACPECGPSLRWLGNYAYPPPVRSSGLWNFQHVGHRPGTDGQLRSFEHLANAARR